MHATSKVAASPARATPCASALPGRSSASTPTCELPSRRMGFLTRDARRVERKKYGLAQGPPRSAVHQALSAGSEPSRRGRPAVADVRLFGTDGVRGRANTELSPRLAFDLARAAGEAVDGPVLIGRDTRRSGPMLAAALHAGFNSVGVDTVDLGIIPVGAVSRLGRDTGAALRRDGECVAQPGTRQRHQVLRERRRQAVRRAGGRHRGALPPQVPRGSRRSAPRSGCSPTMTDAVDRYVGYHRRSVDYSPARAVSLVLDCANGAAFHAAPELFARARCRGRRLQRRAGRHEHQRRTVAPPILSSSAAGRRQGRVLPSTATPTGSSPSTRTA